MKIQLYQTVVISLLVTSAAVGCDDEQIAQLSPRISVCAADDVASPECNKIFDVGEVPLVLGKQFTLYVVNRGNAALKVGSLTSEGLIETETLFPFSVSVQGTSPIEITLTAETLGPQMVEFTLANDDLMRNPMVVQIKFVGIPKPVPDLQFCMDPAALTCESEITVDLGKVRRSQRDSVTFYVKNGGTALLNIEDVSQIGMASAQGELTIGTSTRGGEIEAGAVVPMVVLYEPKDGVDDAIDLVFTSNDPDSPESIAHILASSDVNRPPTAVAYEKDSHETNLDVFVEARIILDGSTSMDPEGDFITYQWTLIAPARSQTALDDPSAGIVSFIPDVAGNYRAELRTFDSLGQASEVADIVLINARPKFKLRVTANWSQGGDVDIHLVDQAGTLFGPDDCYFLNRTPDFGVQNDSSDDPQLRDDSTMSPGTEELVFVLPADGSYQLYLHYFDDAGAGAAPTDLEVVFDDGSVAAFSGVVPLEASCDLWHIGEIAFPTLMFREINAALAPDCR
jgi:archaellum component FlaG (FlaF/FlaG flagellin family)